MFFERENTKSAGRGMLNRGKVQSRRFRRLPSVALPLAGTSCGTLESHFIVLRFGFFIGKINLFFQITLEFYYF